MSIWAHAYQQAQVCRWGKRGTSGTMYIGEPPRDGVFGPPPPEVAPRLRPAYAIGFLHWSPGKREKSPSVEHSVAPCSMARRKRDRFGPRQRLLEPRTSLLVLRCKGADSCLGVSPGERPFELLHQSGHAVVIESRADAQ
jgi:hypothetical protein